jgi:hypothetical protein
MTLSLDFVVYLGDPEQGAKAIDSATAVKDFEQHRQALRFDQAVYGAITVTKNGREVCDKKPDPILGLVTKFVRALPYIIDGEPETALLSESDHGFLFERSNEDVLVSFFRGNDAFAPDEYLIEQTATALDAFGQQVLTMGERMLELLKKWDPKQAEADDYGKSLVEFMDVSKTAFKSYRLEREKGVRRS